MFDLLYLTRHVYGRDLPILKIRRALRSGGRSVGQLSRDYERSGVHDENVYGSSVQTVGDENPDGTFFQLTANNFSMESGAGVTQVPLVDVLVWYLNTPDAEAAKQIICNHLNDRVNAYLIDKKIATSCAAVKQEEPKQPQKRKKLS